MHFSMEMNPEEFISYLNHHYDADKAEIGEKGKLKLVTWLGNLVEVAYTHQEWCQAHGPVKVAGLAPVEWLESELETQRNLPCKAIISLPPATIDDDTLSNWIETNFPASPPSSPKADKPIWSSLFSKILSKPSSFEQFKAMVDEGDRDIILDCEWGEPLVRKKTHYF